METALTDTEQQELVRLLKKMEPGFLPFDIFVQMARLNVMAIIEFVPLRLNAAGNAEVLLLTRGADDPLWPNEVHTPGTVIRPTDTEAKEYLAFERIVKDELKGVKTSAPYFVGSTLHASKRGMEKAQVFWVEVLEEPIVGNFYEVDNLPENMMESQISFVKQAAKSFLEVKAR